jgi:hypothetical protein
MSAQLLEKDEEMEGKVKKKEAYHSREAYIFMWEESVSTDTERAVCY